ncbi:Replication termination factor 2 [Coemansia sp. RSA 1290]|nr:Replication termination factor 2 [Coemansia sp. RSA 1290]KAJ2645657.1 Replication termination factor 2 [Coemansia sp. RSA 1250]
MGNDGGSIPRRNEMVREKKKGEQADRKTQLATMNYFCALSKQPLHEPVVADGMGRLFNREAVLEYLLDPKAFGDGTRICGHIKSIKDVKTLNLRPNPEFSKSDSKKSAMLTYDEQPSAPFICPITRKEMNGNIPFEFIWSCGCVVSAQARKEMPDSAQCLVCSAPFSANDIIPVNSLDPDVLESLRLQMEGRKQQRKRAKRKHRDGDGDGKGLTASSKLASREKGKAQKTAA